MFGRNRMYEALNIAPITSLLSTYGGEAAIFGGTRIPESFKDDYVINYYNAGGYNAAAAYNEYTFTVNCRAPTDYESVEIAYAVINNLNETAVTDGRLYCSLLATIPPFDKTDLYNTPVTVIMKSK